MKDEGRGATLTLSADPSSVSAARRFLTSRLTGTSADTSVAADAVLVVSELVTNAVLHAEGPIVVEVVVSGEGTASGTTAVRIVVSDASPVAPVLREYGDGAATGRGLGLIASLARQWGVETNGSGKAVWVEIDGDSADGTVTPPATELAPPASDRTVGRPVRFLGVPVAGYLCLQEHNDAILRELELLALPPAVADRSATGIELSEVVERARKFFRINREGMRREVFAAAARLEHEIDLESVITVASVAPATELVSLFEDAERLGRDGVLLLGPPDPEVVHLRRWFVDELRRQLVDGAAPAPYVPLEP